MARYFFDLHDGDGPIRDNEGMELASRADVLREMARILVDIARDELPTGERTIISLTVRSEERPISVASLAFSNEWLE